MEILLIRHGKPASATNPKLSALGFVYWIKAYNASSVSPHSKPPEYLPSTIANHYVVSSDLIRAVHSTQLATGKLPKKKYKLLRELEIPRYKLPFQLNAWSWVYLSRILWFFGLKGKFESFKNAKFRASMAADMLIELVQREQKIAVFSHGVLNIYLRKNLKKRGWHQHNKSNDYWGLNRFVRDDNHY